MVSGEVSPSSALDHDPAGRGDLARREKLLEGGDAEEDDKRGVQCLNLSAKIVTAALGFFPPRASVLRRPALHDVGDEHVVPRESRQHQKAFELPPCRADEWPPGLVFLPPGCLIHEHDTIPPVAFTVPRLRSAPAQFALLATSELLRTFAYKKLSPHSPESHCASV